MHTDIMTAVDRGQVSVVTILSKHMKAKFLAKNFLLSKPTPAVTEIEHFAWESDTQH